MPSTHQVLLRATDRWKELWDRIQERDALRERKHVGFTKYCLELWQLAQKILEVARQGDMECAYMVIKPTDSLEELHSFIKRHLEK
jgi:hypothetical protein